MNKRLPLSVGTILQSRYRILRHLGHGGMGAVYEAVNERVSASVALKETFADDDYTRNAFEREAKMLANMTHEAFPRVMDYFAEGDGFYLVMELIRGKDLSELLEERNAPFDTEQVLEWADQILDALEDLHSQDIVHRDIKPSNLKLTPRGRIKLLDFGIAKGAAGDMTALQSTVGSIAAATLQYAPLEQVLRASSDWYMALSVNYSEKTLEILEHGTDARSDLYALGATLYHLLTNILPVNAPTRALTVWSGLADKLRPAHEVNPKISPAIFAVLHRAMELDRNKRPTSASEMRRLLREAGNEKEDETIVADTNKTIPLPIQYALKNREPQPQHDFFLKPEKIKNVDKKVFLNQEELNILRSQKAKSDMSDKKILINLDTSIPDVAPPDVYSSEIQQTLITPSSNKSFLWVAIILGLFLIGIYTQSVIPLAIAGGIFLIWLFVTRITR